MPFREYLGNYILVLHFSKGRGEVFLACHFAFRDVREDAFALEDLRDVGLLAIAPVDDLVLVAGDLEAEQVRREGLPHFA